MIQPAIDISLTLDASPQQVFAAWTQPELLKQWWCMPTHQFRQLEISARPGDGFRYQLTPREGVDLPTCFKEGTFEEVVAGEKLVCTWAIRAGDFAENDARLSVTFRENGEKTDLQLRHTGLQTEAGHQLHQRNWSVVLQQLANFVSRQAEPVAEACMV